MKGWILEESTDKDGTLVIAGNLVATYQGTKAVRSDQVIVFTNARNVDAEDRSAFCLTIEDELIESQFLLNYTILHVNCSQFDFVPFEAIRNRGLRRQAQEVDGLMIGELNVTFTVSGGKSVYCHDLYIILYMES